MADEHPKAKRILYKLYLTALVPLLVIGVPLFLVGVVQVVHDRMVVGEDIKCVKETLFPRDKFPDDSDDWVDVKIDSPKPKFDETKPYEIVSDAEMEKYEQEKKLKIEEILKKRANCNVSRESYGYVYKRAWTDGFESSFNNFYLWHLVMMSIPLFLAGILFAIRKWAIWLAK